jgi:hypothetical protein
MFPVRYELFFIPEDGIIRVTAMKTSINRLASVAEK